jgi:AcrR family transcriptional regulator
MPRRRFPRLPPASRRELLSVASRHFASRGFAKASLNEILAEAGISKGSYYYYFEGKDDLFAAVLAAQFDDFFARVSFPDLGALRRAEFWPTVEAFVAQWSKHADASSEIFKIAVQVTEEQRASPAFAPVLAKAHAFYRAFLEAGVRLGCIRTDLPLELLVRLLEANDAVLDSLFRARNTRVTAASLDAHVRLVFDTFRRLLSVEPPPSGARPKTRSKPRAPSPHESRKARRA